MTSNGLPPILYRPARDTDVERTYEVFVQAADDLGARLGRPARASVSAPPVRALLVRRAVLRHDGERFWVAESDGVVVGFGMAILRDDVWHLAALHVMPAFQGRGIGSALIRRTLDGTRPTTVLTVLTDASNPISNALYLRFGMLPQDSILAFDGLVEGVEAGGPVNMAGGEGATGGVRGLTTRPLDLQRDQAALASIDLATIGFARPTDHVMWTTVPGLAGHLALRGGVVRGYLYASDAGAIGPGAVHDPADLAPALELAALDARDRGASSLHVRVGGSARTAVAWLIEHGFRLSTTGLFLTSRPVGRLDRYATSGGDALY
jgi:ribosomal protein S18 acetylase RimI-like enzyme